MFQDAVMYNCGKDLESEERDIEEVIEMLEEEEYIEHMEEEGYYYL